jgi:hypothetical protein
MFQFSIYFYQCTLASFNAVFEQAELPLRFAWSIDWLILTLFALW